MKYAVIISVAFIMLSLGFFVGTGFCKDDEPAIVQIIKSPFSIFQPGEQDNAAAVKNEEAVSAPVQKAAPVKKTVTDKAEAPKERPPKKELTRSEKISELNSDIADNEEIFNLVPGIGRQDDGSGNKYFTFKGTKIEDLSQEDLDALSVRVNQSIVRIRTDRMQKQLETVSRIERLQRTVVPQPPRVPATAPSSYRTPPAPPRAPPRR